MQVNFTFDKAAVARRGRTLEDVHRTVKSLFAVHDLPCTADDDALSFKDDISKEEIEVNYIFPLLRSLF